MEKNTTKPRIDRPLLDVVEVELGVLDVMIYTDREPDPDHIEGLPETPRRPPRRVH